MNVKMDLGKEVDKDKEVNRGGHGLVRQGRVGEGNLRLRRKSVMGWKGKARHWPQQAVSESLQPQRGRRGVLGQ